MTECGGSFGRNDKHREEGRVPIWGDFGERGKAAGKTVSERENTTTQTSVLHDTARRFLADWPEKVEVGLWKETMAQWRDPSTILAGIEERSMIPIRTAGAYPHGFLPLTLRSA